MSEFVLKALDYGVLGLCAVMVIVAAKILYQVQARPGNRAALLRYVYAFMGFCLLLASLNAYVQLSQKPYPTEELIFLKEQNQELTLDLQKLRGLL